MSPMAQGSVHDLLAHTRKKNNNDRYNSIKSTETVDVQVLCGGIEDDKFVSKLHRFRKSIFRLTIEFTPVYASSDATSKRRRGHQEPLYRSLRPSAARGALTPLPPEGDDSWCTIRLYDHSSTLPADSRYFPYFPQVALFFSSIRSTFNASLSSFVVD